MRHVVIPAVLLVLLAVPSSVRASDRPVGVRTTMPKSIDAMKARLTDLQKRFDAVRTAANRDPAELKIEIYNKYTPKEMKKPRGRDVRAEHLLEFMMDASKNEVTVRQAALDALIKGAQLRGDSDLATDEKQGRMTKRAHFCYREVTPFLKEDKADRMARGLADKLLRKLYPQAERQNPEIKIYHPDREKGWSAAYNAWRDFLRRQ